jgi:hypothetical protein
MHLSLASSPNCSYQTCALDERMSELDNEVLASFIYTNWQVLQRCLFNGQGRLVFLVVKTTLISLGADFSICILYLGFDQSTKGDLVNYNARHDQSTKGN